MNKQANILFIPTSIGGISAEPQDAPSQNNYYQKLIYASLARSSYTIEGFQVLGRKLSEIARHAYLARQIDAVEQASQAMLALPISNQLETIARFYQALCTWRLGDVNTARQSLARVAEEGVPQHRARALQIIGLTYQEHGEVDAALPFYLAAGKFGADCDLPTLVESHRMTAVVRSIHGDHKRALADLERLFPLVRTVGKYYPVLYYDFLNSLAVELGEVGRTSEAESACAIALASPLASAYPEYAETRDEIAAKRQSATPSVVAVSRAPKANPSQQIEPKRKPVSVLAFSPPAFKKDSFQRALIPIAALTAIVQVRVTQTILDQVRACVGPRAPPALS